VTSSGNVRLPKKEKKSKFGGSTERGAHRDDIEDARGERGKPIGQWGNLASAGRYGSSKTGRHAGKGPGSGEPS